MDGTLENHSRGGGSIPASSLYFHIGDTEEAIGLVKRFHYSGRWPANVQFVGSLFTSGGLFGTKGECVAACAFSIPPARWSEQLLELSRLVRGDNRVPLSLLVSLCVRRIWREGMADLLVSFADVQESHHGGIYQACSWKYAGLREPRMEGVTINGSFVPGRSANSAYGTRSPAKLAALLPTATVEGAYDAGKYLYWTARGAGIAKATRLELKSLMYPKPSVTTVAQTTYAKSGEREN